MTGLRLYQHVTETKLDPLMPNLNNLGTSGTQSILLSIDKKDEYD